MTTSRRHDGPGFDFTRYIDALCRDIGHRLSELAHVRMDRVALSFSQTRNGSAYGMFASVTPLRFEGGRTEVTRAGRRWTVQRVVGPDGCEMLYVLTFYLPRFLNLPPREKLSTVVHELWHISPACDGQLRRFKGRCHAHGHSQKAYDARVERLVDAYLATDPPDELMEVLEWDFSALQRRWGRVIGQRVRPPKLIPLAG